jgi:hypothetical protein
VALEGTGMARLREQGIWWAFVGVGPGVESEQADGALTASAPVQAGDIPSASSFCQRFPSPVLTQE